VTAEATTIAFPDQPAYKVRDYIKYLFSRVPREQVKSDSTGNQYTISGDLKLDVRKVREPKRSDLVRAIQIAKKIAFELDEMRLDFTQAEFEIINVPSADLKTWIELWGTRPEIMEFKNYTGNRFTLETPGYLIYDDENEMASLFIRQAKGASAENTLITTTDFERALGYSDRRHLTLSRLDLSQQSRFVTTLKSGQRLYSNLLLIPFPKESTPLRQALRNLADADLTLNKLIVISQSALKKKLDCLGELE